MTVSEEYEQMLESHADLRDIAKSASNMAAVVGGKRYLLGIPPHLRDSLGDEWWARLNRFASLHKIVTGVEIVVSSDVEEIEEAAAEIG